MRERPILFSGPMVRAILDGSKTQTRRVVKPAPVALSVTREDGTTVDQGIMHPSVSPYGEPGDRLWVKETWRVYDAADGDIAYRADGASRRFSGDEPDGHWWRRWGERSRGRWNPSIYMPRFASRLTLEVTGVRVERLQVISEEDARAEGVEVCGGFMATSGCWMNYGLDGPALSTARDSFRSLWESINGAKSWEANPWVWVISVQRVTL